MIALTKGPTPAILVENAARWTRDLLADLARGGDSKGLSEKYRHQDVKRGLIAETHRKCAYCESKPLAVTYGDIEHVVPKKVDPALAFEWTNLTLACDVCNTKKGTHEDLVDPYNDDPQTEFSFYGPMIMHRTGRDKAEFTRITLELNRIDLLERRRGRLENFIKDLQRLFDKPKSAMRDLLIAAAIENETAGHQEYAACVRAHVDRLQRDGAL